MEPIVSKKIITELIKEACAYDFLKEELNDKRLPVTVTTMDLGNWLNLNPKI